jgi:lysophospholipase
MGFVETPDNPIPPGGTIEWVEMGDGARIRTARWMNPVAPVRGSVVLLHGRTEFIEKYAEVIGEMLSRGLCVFTFDWRGQGLSHRALADRHKGHVHDFADFDQDLALIIEKIVLPRASAPLFGLAHSMGGNIFLRYLHDYPGAFERAVLTAPMLAVKTAFPYWFAMALAQSACALGAEGAYIPGGGPDSWNLAFEGNPVTTDPRRYARMMSLVNAEPGLRLASPTYGWTNAAFRSMTLACSREFAEAIEASVLLIGAAHDQIVHPGADMRLIRRLKHGTFLLLPAEHEIMMERDEIWNEFWRFFDAYIGVSRQAAAETTSSRTS